VVGIEPVRPGLAAGESFFMRMPAKNQLLRLTTLAYRLYRQLAKHYICAYRHRKNLQPLGSW